LRRVPCSAAGDPVSQVKSALGYLTLRRGALRVFVVPHDHCFPIQTFDPTHCAFTALCAGGLKTIPMSLPINDSWEASISEGSARYPNCACFDFRLTQHTYQTESVIAFSLSGISTILKVNICAFVASFLLQCFSQHVKRPARTGSLPFPRFSMSLQDLL